MLNLWSRLDDGRIVSHLLHKSKFHMKSWNLVKIEYHPNLKFLANACNLVPSTWECNFICKNNNKTLCNSNVNEIHEELQCPLLLVENKMLLTTTSVIPGMSSVVGGWWVIDGYELQVMNEIVLNINLRI